MANEFPIDVEQFLQQEVSAGMYPDREAVIVEALRMLRSERDEALADLEAGLRDSDAGRLRDAADVFADLRREAGLEDR